MSADDDYSAQASPGDASARVRDWPRLEALAERLLLLLLFVSLAYYIFKNPLRIGWDAANYAQAGDEILRGRIPFADIVDINPPLVQFLHVVPALLGRLIHRPILAFNLYVLASATLSVCTLSWLLKRPELRVTRARRFAMVFGFAFLNHIAWEQGHFGQREHFVVLSFAPYLVLRWLRHEGVLLPKPTALAIGVATATALALKPHYSIPLLFFEGTWLWRHRKLRRLLGTELVGAVVVVAAYVLLFVAYPTMRSEFFGRYLPLFAHGYRVYDCSIRDLFRLTELWIALGGMLYALSLPGADRASRLTRPLAAFVLGSVLVYLMQHKGWPYQIFPAFGLALLATVTAAPLSRRVPLLVALGALGLGVTWHKQSSGKPLAPELRFQVLRSAVRIMTRPGESALIITTSALGPYPLQLQLGVRPGSRFAWLPLLAMFYPQGAEYGCNYRKWGEGLPAERQLLEDLTTDIGTRKPTLIAVESGEAQALRIGCTPSDWLRRSGLLERAMGDYVPLPAAQGFDLWGIRGGRPVPGMKRENSDASSR